LGRARDAGDPTYRAHAERVRTEIDGQPDPEETVGLPERLASESA
jgi:hypothetical protein